MKKILVIEDDQSIRRILNKILTAEGFNVLEAATGPKGVQVAGQELPDLILCDIMLPVLDGYGILTQLRQDQLTAAIPFIFLTAKAERADLRMGMQLGADDYLTKPFTRQELLEAIATRFAKQEAVRQHYTTALQEATEKLDHLLYYDSLTNLPNRLLLRDRFDQVVQELETEKSQLNPVNTNLCTDFEFPILCLSLDRFEWLERTLGPVGCDLLIKAVADRLSLCAGTSNTVARLNAAQFAIILTAENPRQMAADFAQNILNILSLPLIIDTQDVFVTLSIGIAIYPENGRDLDHLLQHSLDAMHHAKNEGGNRYQFYQAENFEKSSQSLAIESSLHYALERNEFLVYYQPKIDIKTNKIVGAEALIRWQHPTMGMISPAAFIPIAEESGLILPIGKWVLWTACQQMKQWRDGGYPLKVAVNLSAQQFNQPDICEQVVEVLQANNLEPSCLELELTESILVQNPEAAIQILSELKGLGIEISVDDFGTGYSSLGYLKQFPFDTLKIDQIFVRNLTDDSKNAAITTALIQLAHNLKLTVIAEGVETEAELTFLRQHQCDKVQGYLFSPPVPPEVLEQKLREMS